MPFATGTAYQFSNQVITAVESIGNGDGVQTVFNYDISRPTAFLGSLQGSYTIGGGVFNFTSDSSGNITGTNIASGTFDGTTISITFSTAPDNATAINLDQYTSKGALQQIVDFATNGVTPFTETVGTGDGTLTNFTQTLSNATIAAGQCLIRFRISGAVYFAYDDGLGGFDHPKISTGSINYSTPSVNITFTDPIDNGFVIEAIYTNSSIAGRDWLLLREDNAKDTSGTDSYPGELLKQFILKNSGTSGKINNNDGGITIGMRESKNAASNIYNYQINIFRNYGETQYQSDNFIINSTDNGSTYNTTNKDFTSMPTTPVNDDVVLWYCSATKNRLLCVFRVAGTVYTNFYLGAGLPYSSILNYPKPFVAIANFNGRISFTDTQTNFDFFICRIGISSFLGGAYYVDPDGNYRRGDNDGYETLPATQFSDIGDLKKTTDDKVLVWTTGLYDRTLEQTLMEFEGAYYTPCTGLASEDDLIVNGSENHLIFQDIFRTDYKDYMSIDTDI